MVSALDRTKQGAVEWATEVGSASANDIRAWLSDKQGATVTNPELRIALRSIAYRRLFNLDAKAAWAFLVQRGHLPDLRLGIAAWAEIDQHQTAAALAEGSLNQDQQRIAEETLLRPLTGRKPEQALALMQEHGLVAYMDEKRLLGIVARSDLPRAVSMLDSIPTHPSGPREAAVNLIGMTMAKEKPAEAYAWLQEVGHPSRATLVSIGQDWGRQAPRQFLEQLDHFPVTGEDKASLLGTAIAGLWQQNPEDAQAYLETLELPENEAQIVEEALARFTKILLFR